MNKVQWIAFRVLMQYIMIICGQLLGMADKDFGTEQYWKTSDLLNNFYNKYDVNND